VDRNEGGQKVPKIFEDILLRISIDIFNLEIRIRTIELGGKVCLNLGGNHDLHMLGSVANR